MSDEDYAREVEERANNYDEKMSDAPKRVWRHETDEDGEVSYHETPDDVCPICVEYIYRPDGHTVITLSAQDVRAIQMAWVESTDGDAPATKEAWQELMARVTEPLGKLCRRLADGGTDG